MQHDSTLPPDQRRGYTNVFQATNLIIKQEGIVGLWRGCTPTVMRAMALNLGMLAPYDQFKEQLSKQHYIQLSQQQQRLTSSAGAGFLAALLSLPFDNAKTKMQKMAKVNNQYPYRNICHCMIKTAQAEGVVGLWVGFPTYYVRIAPHAMITLLVQDFLTNSLHK